ncbi:MAG: hypothetical protein AAGM22_19925 [Acidobacteriota bacterium]
MRDIQLPSLERWPRLFVVQKRSQYAFSQLLERRWWLFLGLNLLFVFNGYLEGAVEGSRVEAIYFRSVLMPSLLLAIPALSGLLALERRAGSLDLALSVPSTERYFLRRAAPVLGVLAAQSVLLLTAVWLENAGGLGDALGKPGLAAIYARAVVQTCTLLAFLGTVALFWSVRLRSSGAVTVASALTIVVFWRWLSTSPRTTPITGTPEWVFGVPIGTIHWVLSNLWIAVAAAIFYLYARERLVRPETMLH